MPHWKVKLSTVQSAKRIRAKEKMGQVNLFNALSTGWTLSLFVMNVHNKCYVSFVEA